MKLRDFIFENKEEILPWLEQVKQLQPYFLGIDLSRQLLADDWNGITLESRPGITISKMPVKIRTFFGNILFNNCGLTTIDNLPDYSKYIWINKNEVYVNLVSLQPIRINKLVLENLPQQTDIENSGNIRIDHLVLSDCPNLRSLKGLNLIDPIQNRINVEIAQCPSIKDNLSRYKNVMFTLTDWEQQPLVELLAYHGVAGHAFLSTLTFHQLLTAHPGVFDMIGKGAHAIPQLVRYFRNNGLIHNIGDLSNENR